MKNVLVLGGVSYNMMVFLDDMPQPRPQTVYSRGFHETVGSTGAGKALNLHKLGVPTTLYGAIGDDEYGRRVLDLFSQAGLTFVYDRDPAGTPRHVNLMDAQGQRISIFILPGSAELPTDYAQVRPLIPPADIVALNIVNYCRPLIPLLKAQNKPIWCDIHDYDGHNPFHLDFIEAADVLMLSSDRMPAYRPFMQRWRAAGKRLVVCTHGRDGATALTAGGEWIEIPSLDYPLQDSNGAGDSFFAGLLIGSALGYTVESSLQLGAVVAGLCVTSRELAFPNLTLPLALQEYQQHYGRQPEIARPGGGE